MSIEHNYGDIRLMEFDCLLTYFTTKHMTMTYILPTRQNYQSGVLFIIDYLASFCFE